MKITVVANEALKEELSQQGLRPGAVVEWINDLPTVVMGDTDVLIDLLFDTNPEERMELLKKLSGKIIITNDVNGTVPSLPGFFIRINGWPGFLGRQVVEAACKDETIQKDAEEIFAAFNKKTEWITDLPGFITARVVSMIINEAYYALEEGVSTKEEIDIAMKTGTNYPYGPFEWSRKIGLKKVHSLLTTMARDSSGYAPSGLLTKEATN